MSTFCNRARKVVHTQVPLGKRRGALDSCIRRFATLVCWQSGWSWWEWHDIRKRLNEHFGFDEEPSSAERLVAAVQALEVERNRLLQVQNALLKRRVARKARGERNVSRAEGAAAWERWQQVLAECPWVDVEHR